MLNAGLVFFGFLNFISILRKPENFAVTYLDVPNVFEKFWVVMDGEIKQIIWNKLPFGTKLFLQLNYWQEEVLLF